MLQIACYARLSKDVTESQTKDKKLMAYTTAAVDVTPGNSEPQRTAWLSVVAFGKQSEQRLKHSNGDLVSLHGRATLDVWQDKDGNDFTGLTLIVDSIVSALTAQPDSCKKHTDQNNYDNSIPKVFG